MSQDINNCEYVDLKGSCSQQGPWRKGLKAYVCDGHYHHIVQTLRLATLQ